MFRTAAVALLVIGGLLVASPANGEEKKMTVAVKRVTPVLFVEKVEPCLEFWEQLGFKRAMEVPDGEALAFAAVQKDGVEIMYQSFASAMKDASASAAIRQRLESHAFLYVEVADRTRSWPDCRARNWRSKNTLRFTGPWKSWCAIPAGTSLLSRSLGRAGIKTF